MAKCPHVEYLLVIPRLRVQNANAISSPLTHGFPSITAFIGLMWALERKTLSAGLELQFNAVGVVAHGFAEQITDGGFTNEFRLTRNPVDKDGSTAAIVEEGRIHLDISLVFAVAGPALDDDATAADTAKQVRDMLSQMRIAGGSVIEATVPATKRRPYIVALPAEEEPRDRLFSQLKLRLLPGFTLVERPDLLEKRHSELQEAQANASKLDAWLSLARINWRWQTDADGKSEWQHDRKDLGWVVPIPVGYGALGAVQEPGSVANVRDRQTPFCFVESLYGIGQWLSPHRLSNPQHLLWYPDSQPENGLYRCRNDYRSMPVFELD
ncbi:type I-F CRISPR-associated protein Csy2 [Pseudomonas sp. 5P_3.1_Bac2]|uniref:type I-F CRISPR-associated protein Csy2 n=1 Tax=Pseudomonas sp. 5P_3.1_Bac2 TaxID=2971617 RepID=UPI0021C90AA0|nr:type I-F CRISPR-associated protein Csy2 [Pseudomonas sp. 5P_3.1_Bac2]MCU1718626.1 type I-F CRISPR-associated protein Csy2 [Pseudomonas sp. 5P_3.1_Bac2]